MSTTGTQQDEVFRMIARERERQEKLCEAGIFPWSCASVALSPSQKLAVLMEETGELAREVNAGICFGTWNPGSVNEGPTEIAGTIVDGTIVEAAFEHTTQARREKIKEELIEIAAVAVAWLESMK